MRLNMFTRKSAKVQLYKLIKGFSNNQTMESSQTLKESLTKLVQFNNIIQPKTLELPSCLKGPPKMKSPPLTAINGLLMGNTHSQQQTPQGALYCKCETQTVKRPP